jgi:hypothetical protein
MAIESKISLSSIIAYCVAAVSAAASVYIILFSATDFFDPESLSFQLSTLSRPQILILDSVAIVVHLLLLYFLYIYIKRRRVAIIYLLCAYIWVATIAQLLFEQSFQIKLAYINQYSSCAT